MINTYEQISGAEINIEKSIIRQMGEFPKPEWLHRMGCKIVAPDKVVIYLGSPIGTKLSTSRETKFLVEKFKKHLNHWANLFLTM